MNNHSQQELLNFWKKGKTLNDALCQFTDRKVWQEYQDLNYETNSDNRNLIKDNPENILKLLSIGIDELNKMSMRTQQIGMALDKLKSNLLSKIISEKLIGVGFEHPLKASDYPAIIPLHIWPEKIDQINWDNSSISQNGIQYSKIRVIKKTNSKTTASSPIPAIPEIQIKDKKTGRPSHANKISDMYERLKNEGKINYSKPLNWNIELIRTALFHTYPELNGNPKGLGDDAISNKIAARFNADKLTYKLT